MQRGSTPALARQEENPIKTGKAQQLLQCIWPPDWEGGAHISSSPPHKGDPAECWKEVCGAPAHAQRKALPLPTAAWSGLERKAMCRWENNEADTR